MRVSDVTTQFPDKVAIQALIDELKAYADGIATGDIDLSNYVTKSELQAKLDTLDINIDLSSYVTKEELTDAINSIDLSAYAKKSDIPTVPTKVSELENDSGYLTEHQDLSAYALKTEIPSVARLASTEYVDNAVSNIPTTDLSNYYTKDETYNKEEIDTLVANSGGSSSGGSSGGITYAFDTEIATGETWVDGKPIYMRVINLTDIKPSSNGGYNLYMTVCKDWLINEVIDSRIALRNGASNYTTENPYQGTIAKTTSTATIINNINSYIITRGIYHNVITSPTQTTIQVFIGTTYNNATKKIYLTVKYTKP